MRQAILNLKDISQLTVYKPIELRRLQDRQDKLLATWLKELTLVERQECPGGVTRYCFSIPPARKARKPSPLGYTPIPPLECRTTHDPYYSWRVRTAEACTCKPRGAYGRRGEIQPHVDAYKTERAAHALNCKAHAVLIEGGFV